MKKQTLITGHILKDPTELIKIIRNENSSATPHDLYHYARQKKADISGFGLLDKYIYDPTITDILISSNGIYCDSGQGLYRLAIHLGDEDYVRSFAIRLAYLASCRIDDAHPWADGCIIANQGAQVRLHAVLPPLVADGTCISLRILRAPQWTFNTLHSCGMFDNAATQILHDAIESRKHLIIIGATGSGKTTLLQAILGEVPSYERIITIEDSAELSSLHNQHIRLVSRKPNSDGAGEISLSELVKQALRMRPDRIFLGEIRGKEMLDLLIACNTGHAGGATLHANSAYEVPQRIMALASLSGLSSQAINYQVDVLNAIIVQLDRCENYRRKIRGIFALEKSTLHALWHHPGENNHDSK